MIKYIGIGLAALALVGCTRAAPAPTVTVTAPAPPAVTVVPTPEVDSFYQTILQEAWDDTSASDKEDMCFVFNAVPDQAWDAFNQGADGLVPRSEYDAFFTSVCASY